MEPTMTPSQRHKLAGQVIKLIEVNNATANDADAILIMAMQAFGHQEPTAAIPAEAL